ncbi:MAG: MMPL family transporter [Acidimicrobiales bacterium]
MTDRTSTPAPPLHRAGLPGRLAAWCHDRRRLVLVLWVALLVVASVASAMVGSDFHDKFDGGHSEAQKARDLLVEHFPSQAGDSAQIVFRVDGSISAPEIQDRIAALDADLATLPHVVSVRGPFDPGALGQLSQQDQIAYTALVFDKPAEDIPKAAVQRVVDKAKSAGGDGLQVELGGEAISKVTQATPGTSEVIGIAAAIVILLVAFGSVIAMGLPIITALFGIGVGIAIVGLLSRWLVVPTFGPELAAMIGIGVGIDYALFIVTRYRQGLAEGREPRDAVVKALDTSGRAVLFAGTTVVISLFGMFLLGAQFIYGLALGAIASVLLVMLASMTLLPAMLGFSGLAIDRLRIPGFHRPAAELDEHGFWYRWSRIVQRRPWTMATVAFVILVVMAIPVLSMHLLFSDSGNDPTTLTTRQAYDLLSEGFGPGANGPLVVALDVPTGTPPTALEGLSSAIAQTPHVAIAVPPRFNEAGDAATLIVIPDSSPQSAETESRVHRLRNDVVPTPLAGSGVQAYVGGYTAAGIDAADTFSQRLVWVIGAVVVLSFLLLMAVFRSIAVPIKAAIMNLLSIGAAYGVIVAVFQWGWLGGVFGVSRTGPIDPWIPLMLFTILFGLSMDYEVFLLSRIREEWLRTGDNATSVADGLAQTGRVITAAAAIMFCVFGSFVLGDLRVLKVFGLGLAAAVLIDATIVRMVLVPATMELLGPVNWWFPSWLDRLIPMLDVEGPVDEVEEIDLTDKPAPAEEQASRTLID